MESGKNYSVIAYNTANELKKDKTINENNLYSKKFQKFTIPKATFTGEYNYKISLECENESILQLHLEADFSENTDVQIVINNIIVYDKNIAGLNIYKQVIVTNCTEIAIKMISANSVEISEFELVLNGNFKIVTNKNKFILKSKDGSVYVAKQLNSVMGFAEYSSIDEFNNNYYFDESLCEFSNLLDFAFMVDSDSKTNKVYLYKNENNELILSSESTSKTITANEVNCACVLPIDKEGAVLEVVYVTNNIITVVLLDSAFNILSSKNLEHNIREKIIEIGSIDNTTYLNFNAIYFVTNNNNIYVQFAKSWYETVYFNMAYKACKGERCLMYSYDDTLYLFSYFNNCLTLTTYKINNILGVNNANKISTQKFYNCDNGFLFNGSIYVISGKSVSKVSEL